LLVLSLDGCVPFLRADLLTLRPEPESLPPPESLFTVAHARDAATSLDRPFDS